MNSRLIAQLSIKYLQVENAQASLEEFVSFYNKTISQIYAYICYRTDNLSDAEDLTAETYEKALKKWNHLRRNEEERQAWLFRVAHNIVIDYHRKKYRNKGTCLDNMEELTSHERTPEEYTVFSEDLKRIRKCLSLIPEIERDVVALRFSTELSYRQIAQVMGLSESNVGTLLHRAIQKLRNCYEQDHQ